MKYDSQMSHMAQSGDTALHIAASKGHLEIATLLIHNGCDLYASNRVYNI